jgi:ankyrin repeat protein
MSDAMDKADARRLIRACFESPEAARALLDAEPGLLFARDGLGETALHYLVVEDQLEAVKFLFGRGATLNTVSDVNGSPLSEAASLGYEAMVEWLLANGAEIELEGQGEPTLLNAATSGNASIVAMLLGAGANVDIVNDIRETALHCAAESDERLLVTELLLGAGAQLDAIRWGDTPLDVAIDNGAVATAGLLRSRGATSLKHHT